MSEVDAPTESAHSSSGANAIPADYSYDVVVLGAGIQGLSIASELVSRGLKPAILARDLPTDLDSASFASPWAGANWFSFAGDEDLRAQEWDRRTFLDMVELSKTEEGSELVEIIPFKSYVEGVEGSDQTSAGLSPWYKDLVFDYTPMPPSSLKPNTSAGATWRSLIFNPPALLSHLHTQLRNSSPPVPFIRARVSSLDEAYNHPQIGKVKLVVNATALGARSLLGVMDEKVYPVRGQTVLVRAPGVKTCMMKGSFKPGQGNDKVEDDPEPSQPIYIIPRAGSLHHVILGGTYLPNDYSCLPSMTTARRILQQCYKLCPDLAGPNGKSWKDIQVVSHQVGLRPAREGGMRLELERRTMGGVDDGGLQPNSREQEVREVGCVHAYGIGPAGYQSCRGVAVEAADLVQEYLGSI